MAPRRIDPPAITFTPTSAGGYEVRIGNRIAGHVGKVGRRWHARMLDFDLGEHPTRHAAAEAIADVDRT